jgi:hypothetical protein
LTDESREVDMPEPEVEIDRMNRVIAGFCAAVVTEPLCYFSEADLQGFLFTRLIEAFPEQVETSYSRGPGSKGMYRTGIVHREYGAEGGRRTDISVFSRQDVAAIDNPNLTVGRKYIVPRFAIELGTEKTSDTQAHVAHDLAKLSRATERGYLIHFFRDVTRADPGTPWRARTEDKLQRIFKGPVSEAVPPDHVSYLCFLIRIARTGKTIRGKCEMLVAGTGAWRKVNLTRVRDDVLALLSAQPATEQRDQADATTVSGASRTG